MQKRDAQRSKLIHDGRKASAMFAAGVSAGNVSKALGRSRMTVWRAVKAAELADSLPAAAPALDNDPLLDGLYSTSEPAPSDSDSDGMQSDLDEMLR